MAANEDDLRGESQTALIISLAIVFPTLSLTSVLLRLYTRTRILRIFGADDVTISIAQVLAIAVSVTTVLEAVWGLGRHTQFVSPQDAIRQLKCLYANMIIYNAAQICTKISFLIQYRRLFPSDRIQIICFWLLILIATWGVAQEFIVAFSCIPLTAFLPHLSSRCISSLPVWYLTSSMNIVTDFMIFFIPIIPVLRLRISSRKKILLLFLFSLGFFTCIISLIRLTTLHRGVHTRDPFWDNAPTAYWSVVELNCGILCACLPTLRPLVARVVPRLLSRGSGGGGREATETETGTGTDSGNDGVRDGCGCGGIGGKRVRERERDVEDGICVTKEVDIEVELSSVTELRRGASMGTETIGSDEDGESDSMAEEIRTSGTRGQGKKKELPLSWDGVEKRERI